MASAVVLESHGLIAIQDLKPAYEYEPVNSLKMSGLARPSWHSTYLRTRINTSHVLQVIVSKNALMRTQRHAFSETGDNERISDGKEGEVLRECKVLSVEKDNRLVGERRKAGVDA